MRLIHNLLIVNEHDPLDAKWIPRDLIWDPISNVWVVKSVYEAFYALNQSIQQQGVPALRIGAGYRSYAMQKNLYQKYIFMRRSNLIETDVAANSWCDRWALPGTSEHQLGTVIDILPYQYSKYTKEELIDESVILNKWLEDYARNYGFILTNADEKPWHYRYVGIGHAKKIKRLGTDISTYVQYIQHNCII